MSQSTRACCAQRVFAAITLLVVLGSSVGCGARTVLADDAMIAADAAVDSAPAPPPPVVDAAPPDSAPPYSVPLECRPSCATPDASTAVTYVKGSNTSHSDGFGTSISLSGDTLAVGAPSDSAPQGSGAVYVFVRESESWCQQAILKPTVPSSSFGHILSLSGDTLAAGTGETGISVFVRKNGSWIRQPFAPAIAGGWICALSLSGNTLAVACGNRDINIDVFVRQGTTWTEQASLTAVGNWPIPRRDIVSLSGDTLVVGGSPSEANIGKGAIVFVRKGGSWSQQAYLNGSNTEYEDSFGAAVSLSGDTLAVGAPNEDSAATGVNGDESDNSAGGAGAVYVFVRQGSTWSQQAYLKASNTEAKDFFGSSVSLSGDTLAVAASGEDSAATGINGNQSDNSADGAGAVYVFKRTNGVWSQQAYLKAPNAEAGDWFGASVSASGNTVAVGAPGEDSAAACVNGGQSGNSAPESGAAYIYETP